MCSVILKYRISTAELRNTLQLNIKGDFYRIKDYDAWSSRQKRKEFLAYKMLKVQGWW